MERESIMYVCEEEQPADSVRSLLRVLKKPLSYTEFDFGEQSMLCVPVPIWRGGVSPGDNASVRRMQPKAFFYKILNRYYIRKLQSDLWQFLLACQNTSLQPAFCSDSVFFRFCKEDALQRELWLTNVLPNDLVGAALMRFMKKDCVFRRQTRIFVICSPAVPVQKLLAPYCGSLNYLELLTEERETYEEFAGEVFEQFGLAISFTSRKEGAGRADVIIDLSPEQVLEDRHVRAGCVYFDGFSHANLQKALVRRKDVFYFCASGYWKKALKKHLNDTYGTGKRFRS